MCGIAGYYCWGNARPEVNAIKGLLHAAQSRGTDAAGVAYQRDVNGEDKIVVLKSPGKAEDFIRTLGDERWAEIAASPRALLHARAKTKGDAKDNVNNHPVHGLDWVVVHNGHVNNDDDLFAYAKQESGIKRFAEVDTAAIPLVLSQGKDNYLDSLGYMASLGGNITAAVWSGKWIDKIALVRLGSNDLYLIHDREKNILYWTSTLLATHSLPAYYIGKKLKMVTLGQLNDDRVLTLDPSGTDATGLLEIKRQSFFMSKAQITAIMKDETTPPPVSRATGSLTQTRKKGSISGDGGRETPARKHKWSRDSLPKRFSNKPDPMWTSVPLMYEAYHAKTILSPFEADPKKIDVVLPTAYGNWYFTRVPGEKSVDRKFRPHKRIKSWYRGVYANEQLAILLDGLPMAAVDSVPAPLFDRVLPLETFLFQDTNVFQNGVTEHMSRPGFMCPWCGIIGDSKTWASTDYRCWLCRVKSTIPGGN